MHQRLEAPGTWKYELGARVASSHVDWARGAGCAVRVGSKNDGPGQIALGGIAIVGLFRGSDRARRVRFAIAWTAVKF